MLYLIKNKKIKELLTIGLIYFAIHWFLLIITGRWWDDWCFYNQEDFALKKMALDMGRPEVIFIMKIFQLLPYGFDRIMTFIIYFYISLFFYKILVEGLNLSHKDSLLITLFFLAIPCNSERILLCIFPYTFGFFFFMLAFLKLIDCLNTKLDIINRVILLMFFLLSFVLNSNLFFYGIVLLYIVYKNKSLKCLIKYIDFIVLPILFFVLKNKLFPVSGLYANYNSITINSLLKSIVLVLPSCIFGFWNVLIDWFVFNKYISCVLFCLSIFILLLINYRFLYSEIKTLILNKFNFVSKNNSVNYNESNKYIFLLAIGIIILCFALFPYVAIRQTFKIVGRDLVLAPVGISLILYAIVLIFSNKYFYKCIIIVFIIYSIGYFNYTYLNYQNAYYRINGLQYQFNNKKELKSYKTLLYVTDDKCNNDYNTFYALNAAIEDVYNDQNRFILGSYEDLSYMNGKNEKYNTRDFVKSRNYHMNGFDYEYKELDVIVLYRFNCNLLDTLKLKCYEVFNNKEFENEIRNRSSLSYYIKGSEQYNNYIKYQNVSVLR